MVLREDIECVRHDSSRLSGHGLADFVRPAVLLVRDVLEYGEDVRAGVITACLLDELALGCRVLYAAERFLHLDINGTYWAGAAVGALLTVPATNDLPADIGWRVCFGL
jgi:hypothetical protein